MMPAPRIMMQSAFSSANFCESLSDMLLSCVSIEYCKLGEAVLMT